MQIPLQITFRNMSPSFVVQAHIRERAKALGRRFGRIMACRVMVEASARHHRKGKLYHVRVDLTVPGREIVVSRDPAQHQAHEDALVAVRDAFDAASRRLQDYARTARSDVKLHAVPDHGRIARLFKEKDYAFIRSSTGDEIYMHRNALAAGSFDALAEGDEVRYVVSEGEGDMGPQASTVTLVGKHHPTA